MGIANTGSGKSLTFIVPMLMRSLEQELFVPLEPREGPVTLLLCPSRELAKQSYDIATRMAEYVHRDGNLPQIRTMLCTGGIDMRDAYRTIDVGVHMVFATPGRLLNLLSTNKLSLGRCVFLCMDEADRLVDLGFEDDLRTLMSYFT